MVSELPSRRCFGMMIVLVYLSVSRCSGIAFRFIARRPKPKLLYSLGMINTICFLNTRLPCFPVLEYCVSCCGNGSGPFCLTLWTGGRNLAGNPCVRWKIAVVSCSQLRIGEAPELTCIVNELQAINQGLALCGHRLICGNFHCFSSTC